MADLRTDWKTEDELSAEYQDWYERYGLPWNRMIAKRKTEQAKERDASRDEA